MPDETLMRIRIKIRKADKNENTKIFNLDTKKVTRRAIWINIDIMFFFALFSGICLSLVDFFRASVYTYMRGSCNFGHTVFFKLVLCG